MKTHFQYAGHNWSLLKHSRFGANQLTYELIFAQAYVDGVLKYICFFRDLEKRKIIESIIGESFLSVSDHYFTLLCTYA